MSYDKLGAVKRWRWLRGLGVGWALVGAACGRTGLQSYEGGTAVGGSAGNGGAGSGASGSVGTSGTVGTAGMVGIAGGGSGGAPVGMPLEILPEELPHARVRWRYAASLAARGGAGAPYTFELQQGQRPGDMILTEDGRLEGTPDKVGDYPIRVQVRDRAGGVLSRDYLLRVDPPRFMAYATFLSSSSSRTALFLADLTTPTLETYELADGVPNSSAFSPDGRWFAFCDHISQGNGEMYLVDTSGEVPGPLVPLLEAGKTTDCAGWAWSPDSRHLAYVSDGWLWLTELNEAGVARRTQAVHAALSRGLSWPATDLVVFRDFQGRANLLRLDARGSFLSQAVVDAENSTLLALSQNGALAFGTGDNGYLLVDGNTGSIADLGHWPAWYMSPTFELLLGRSATGEFATYSPQKAVLPAPVRSGTGGTGFGVVAFANPRPALAQEENAQLVVTELRDGGVLGRALGGAYEPPRRASFDSAGEVLVFADRNAVWASDTTGSGTLTAQVVSQYGPNAQNQPPVFTLANQSPQLLAGGGDPYELRLVDVRDPQKPLVSPVGAQLLWSEAVWSRDDTHLAILGGSAVLGRVLFLVTPDRPQEPTTVIRCNGNGGAAPICPSIASFQP